MAELPHRPVLKGRKKPDVRVQPMQLIFVSSNYAKTVFYTSAGSWSLRKWATRQSYAISVFLRTSDADIAIFWDVGCKMNRFHTMTSKPPYRDF